MGGGRKRTSRGGLGDSEEQHRLNHIVWTVGNKERLET